MQPDGLWASVSATGEKTKNQERKSEGLVAFSTWLSFPGCADSLAWRCRPLSARSQEAIMLIRICLLLCLAAAVPAHAQPDKANLNKELRELRGVWRLIGFQVEGKEAFLQEHRQIRWVIKDDKVFYGGEQLATLTLDPATNPKCLDLGLVKTRRVHEGIYKLDKDRLTICVRMMTDGVKQRPLKFDNGSIEKYRTMLFVRDKPGTELEGAAGFVGVQMRIDKMKEIRIVTTIKGSPAQKAGLKKDDVLVRVGSDPAGDLQQTVNLVRELKPGSEAVLRVRRAGKEQDIKVKVGVAPFLFFDF
jgi:uncharacterized protein (TIGR03067 family)